MMQPLTDLESALRTYLIHCLEARLTLCEMQRSGLDSLIDSPATRPETRATAIESRDAVLIEWDKIKKELGSLRTPIIASAH
jgi:hypothetical protein